MGSSAVSYKISSAYEAFLEAFRLTAEDAACEVSFPSLPIANSFRRADSEAVFAFTIYVKQLPCRRLSKTKRLDLVIHALETLERSSWTLQKSTVYLNYFVISSSGGRLVQSMHYDFVHGGQADHPYFHLQFDTDMISAGEFQSIGFDTSAIQVPEEDNESWVTTRIPTADMTLSSVLYSVVADHLGTSRFVEFAKKTDALYGRLPTLDFGYLKKSLEKEFAHFKSMHWFAHMFAQKNK